MTDKRKVSRKRSQKSHPADQLVTPKDNKIELDEADLKNVTGGSDAKHKDTIHF